MPSRARLALPRCWTRIYPQTASPDPVRTLGAELPASGRLVAHRGREVRGGAVDEVAGDVGEMLVRVPGVIAQHLEGVVHVDAEPLGELALGLLDHHPAVQRGLELLDDVLAAAHVPSSQQASMCKVG